MTTLFSSAVSTVGKAMRSVASSVMDWNTGTFSGAVDVIVVRRKGEKENEYIYDCTPFHVKFGMFQVMNTSDRDISIEINGKISDLNMRLSKNGFGYFPSANKDRNTKTKRDIKENSFETIFQNTSTKKFLKKNKNKMANLSCPEIWKLLDKEDFDELNTVDYNHIHSNEKQENVSLEEMIRFEDIQLSLCREKLEKIRKEEIKKKDQKNAKPEINLKWPLPFLLHNKKAFEEERVSFKDFKENFSLLENENLVALYNRKLYPRRAFVRFAVSNLVYGPQTVSEIDDFLETKHDNGLETKKKNFEFYRRKRRNSVDITKLLSSPESLQNSLILSNGCTKHARSIKPTSSELQNLGLRKGLNLARFSVTSTLQGTQMVEAAVYLWEEDTKIVVTDIDGTITRSNVLGLILPNFGNNWAHNDVAKLFRGVCENGYCVLYLTARLMSLSEMTRKYLFGLDQTGGERLPEGPILSVPFDLFTAYKRDHNTKPQEMKISILREVLKLFHRKFPFYSGFGNRETDTISYEAVGIPSARIFIINPKGEIIKHNAKHSYGTISESVNQIFPPVRKNHSPQDVKYGLNYWKIPIPKNLLNMSLFGEIKKTK